MNSTVWCQVTFLKKKLHAIHFIDLYVCLTKLLSCKAPPLPSPGRSGSSATSGSSSSATSGSSATLARLEGGKFMKEICVHKALHKAVAKTPIKMWSLYIIYLISLYIYIYIRIKLDNLNLYLWARWEKTDNTWKQHPVHTRCLVDGATGKLGPLHVHHPHRRPCFPGVHSWMHRGGG